MRAFHTLSNQTLAGMRGERIAPEHGQKKAQPLRLR
jgi:hypothetical protein